MRVQELAFVAVALVLVPATGRAQSVKVTEDKPGLFARAKVSSDSAQKLALAHVAHGKIAKGEIEEEDGKLIYSFDIKVPGKSGIEEVHIDAVSGAFVKKEHENAASEKKEKAAEKKEMAEKKAAAKKKP